MDKVFTFILGCIIGAIMTLCAWSTEPNPLLVCHHVLDGIHKTTIISDKNLSFSGVDSYCFVEYPEDIFFGLHQEMLRLHSDTGIYTFNKM